MFIFHCSENNNEKQEEIIFLYPKILTKMSNSLFKFDMDKSLQFKLKIELEGLKV